MKKLKKLSLSQLAQADLNEREMCFLLGGGDPGNCQCGCHYEGEPGGSTTSANNSANNALGYSSDPGGLTYPSNCYPDPIYPSSPTCYQQDNLCH